ncbi:MAG: DNA gyrase inhibitor YacG [Pseudobdellovibrio sp.]
MTSRQIKCPQCGRLTFYSPENPFRPFCSDRCKLIDLGQWASESFKIPTNANVDLDAELNSDEFKDAAADAPDENDDHS